MAMIRGAGSVGWAAAMSVACEREARKGWAGWLPRDGDGDRDGGHVLLGVHYGGRKRRSRGR